MLPFLAEVDTPKSVWMPIGASSISGEIDWLFYFILYVCYFFTALIFFLTVFFAWKYRMKKGGENDRGTGPSHNLLLELSWSIAPGIILMLVFVWGFRGFMTMAVMPPEYQTLEIRVTGKKWNWQFEYPNGYSDPELHLPKGEPVRLVLMSDDVIHSLYMPAFRNKKDVVPGRYNKMWVEATEESPLDKSKYTFEDPVTFRGDEKRGIKADPTAGFDIFCTEYCGQQHSTMLSKVHVHPTRASYEEWLKKASDLFGDPTLGGDWLAIGGLLAKQNGCQQCHSIDGMAGTGPTWKNLYNKQGQFVDGTSYTADDNYLRESILYSGKHVVAGFGNVMPVYVGKFTDRDLTAIIRYIKSLNDQFKTPEAIEELKKPDPKLMPEKPGTEPPPAK